MHIVSGELRKAPYVKPNVGSDGQSCLFIVELSEMIKDFKTGEKSYTNYSAALFAKGGQIDFYNTALVEGNFIVVTGDKIKIKVSDCGQYTKLELENARLENSKYIESTGQQQTGGFAQPQAQQQPNQGYVPQQQAQQQQMQQQPQQSYAPQQPQQPQAMGQQVAQQQPQQQYQQPNQANPGDIPF